MATVNLHNRKGRQKFGANPLVLCCKFGKPGGPQTGLSAQISNRGFNHKNGSSLKNGTAPRKTRLGTSFWCDSGKKKKLCKHVYVCEPVCIYIYIYIYMYIHACMHTNITYHYITLRFITIHYTTIQYIAVHPSKLTYITYSTLHYITFHYNTLHYNTVHCSTSL